jgi:hypothetical protein
MAAGLKFGKLLKEVAAPALTSGSLAGGFALLTGASPIQALATAATDTVASGASLGLLRKLSPQSYAKRTLIDPKTKEKVVQEGSHPMQGWLNFGTSVGMGQLVNPMIYGTNDLQNQVIPTDTSQSQQILQENIQRDLLNSTLAGKYGMPNAYSPGTMFQMQGLEATLLSDLEEEFAQQLMQGRYSSAQKRGALYDLPELNLASITRDMGAIVGV